MPRHALLLVNRDKLRDRHRLEAAVERLCCGGISITEEVVDGAGRMAGQVRRHRADAQMVIVAGGDGTVNAAADAVRALGLPLGILPMGTANDLARTLGIPPGLEDAADVIVAGQMRSIDVGCVNGKHFFNVANIGLGAAVTRRLSGAAKQRWGVLSYPLGVLEAVREARPFRAAVRCDGTTAILRTIQIAVGNGRHYGGGMTIADDAAIDDRRLDLYALDPLSGWRLAVMVPALRRGSRPIGAGMRRMRGREIEVFTPTPMAVSTDGELTTQTPARFWVVPAAISVFVPPEAAETRDEVCHAAR